MTAKPPFDNVVHEEAGRAGVLAMVACTCFVMGACGNGENPLQAAAKLFSKAGTTAKDAANEQKKAAAGLPDDEDRYVAFESSASHLVAGDTNRVTDVFVFDRQTKQTARVSVSSTDAQADGGSFLPHLSRDGRFVAFESLATNLVPNDTNKQRDVFVHDRRTGETVRVSVSSSGDQANNFSQSAQLSGDGRFVVFESLASNLVQGDTNGVIDIFVHDRATGQTTRVSVATDGTQANNTSVNPTLSVDGRYVAFDSFATNLTDEKPDGPKQTFVYDRETGRTTRASADRSTALAGGPPAPASLHADKP